MVQLLFHLGFISCKLLWRHPCQFIFYPKTAIHWYIQTMGMRHCTAWYFWLSISRWTLYNACSYKIMRASHLNFCLVATWNLVQMTAVHQRRQKIGKIYQLWILVPANQLATCKTTLYCLRLRKYIVVVLHGRVKGSERERKWWVNPEMATEGDVTRPPT